MKTTAKYTIRRFIVATLLAPVIAGAHWVAWAIAIALGATGNYATVERNAWTIAIVFIVTVTYYPQIRQMVDRVLGNASA